MADSQLTFGIGFEADDSELLAAGSALDEIESAASDVESALAAAGAAGGDAGRALEEAMKHGGTALDGTSAQTKTLNTALQSVATESKSTGDAFRKMFTATSKEGGKLGASLKAGIGAAFDYNKKRAMDFGAKASETAKGVGNAFLHPIDTIKNKLSAAFDKAGESMKDAGEEGEAAGAKIEDMSTGGAGGLEKLIGLAKNLAVAFVALKVIADVTKKVIEFGKQSVQAFLGAEQAANKLSLAFEDQAALEWFDSYAKAVNRPMAEVRTLASESKGIFDAMSIGESAATDMSKAMVGLTYDLTSVTGASETETFELLRTAMEGDSKAAGKLGLNFSETALQAQAAADGYKKQYSELSEAEQATVRMNAALEQSNDIAGKAVDGQEGLANSMKSVNGVWQNFMAEAGEKFAPVLEDLLGKLLEMWPELEPKLMGLAEMLAGAFEEAAPAIMEFAENVLPGAIEMFEKIFEAVKPLIPVILQLAETVLPPLMEIFGTLADTILPPFAAILDTIVNSVLKPLMPVIQRIAEAILPPIAAVLEAISPLLEAISPILEIIGEAIGFIADVIGKIIGFAAEGIGKVADFFGKIFGGSKKAKEGTDELGASMESLDTGKVASESEKSFSNVDKSAKTTYSAVETSAATSYGNINTQGETAASAQESSLAAVESAGTDTYSAIQTQGENAWNSVADASDRSTQRALDNITAMNRAAAGMTGYGATTALPKQQHAKGTDFHPGGLALVGEEGPEIVDLPRGSAVYTANETSQMLSGADGSTARESNVIDLNSYMAERRESSNNKPSKESSDKNISIQITVESINITGGDSDEVLSQLEETLRRVALEAANEAIEAQNDYDFTGRQAQW